MKKRIFLYCTGLFLLGIIAAIIAYIQLAPLLPGLLAGLYDTPVPIPSTGPAVYILKEADLPEGAKIIQYQEVPHPQCTEYADLFKLPDGLQIYSKICCRRYPGRLADLSLQWPNTIRVDAPTVGQESMTFRGPVLGKPSVTVEFLQGQCDGMVQVIGNDDESATNLAIKLAETVAKKVPLTVFPTLSAQEISECYKTIEITVSNSEFGSPTTLYKTNDIIFPMVSNPFECGSTGVKLIDSNGKTVVEKSFGVASGMTGFGDFNIEKNLAPGDYKMELWYGDILLKSIKLIVR